MIKKYVQDVWNGTLHVLRMPSYKAPPHTAAGILGSPNQTVQQAPRLPQYPEDNGPQVALFTRLHHQDTVATIPVKQHQYILRAPDVPTGPKRTDVPDNRLGLLSYPLAFSTGYPRGAMEAPPVYQSIPGYVVYNGITQANSPGYPRGALRAPKPRTGGGQCNDG
jgi:hypothetical protein